MSCRGVCKYQSFAKADMASDRRCHACHSHHACAMQILHEFLDAFQKQSRPVEQLVQAASLLILPMLETGYDAGEHIVDEESLTTMVNSMFDQQDSASSAWRPAHD